MQLDGWEAKTRALGAALAGLGLLGFAVGLASLALGSTPLGVRFTVGGLIGGLVGALLLLVAADTVPPSERP